MTDGKNKGGRPTLPESARLVVVPVRMTPDQRDKFRAMKDGAARLRAWVDRVKG